MPEQKNAQPLLFGIFANTDKPDLFDALRPLLQHLRQRRIAFLVEDDVKALLAARKYPGVSKVQSAPRARIAREADVVMTFGGDGTLLAAAQETLSHNTPILGVNLGKLGFLADVNMDESRAAIDAIIDGRYRVEPRMTLSASLDYQVKKYHALNDIVISKSGKAHVVHIEAYFDGQYLATFLADGIIVATPTGSTAYSLATGGPIVVPSSDVIVVSPISAHALTTRPMIVPGRSELVLHTTAETGSIMAMADGQMITENRRSFTIRVRKGQQSVQLVKDIGPEYFDTLRRKLSWAQDHRFLGTQDRSLRNTRPEHI
jgi:NAD+ kinase